MGIMRSDDGSREGEFIPIVWDRPRRGVAAPWRDASVDPAPSRRQTCRDGSVRAFRIARAHLGPGARQAHAVERAPARGARLRGEPALAGRFHPGERHHRARGDCGDGSHGSRVWIRGRSPEDASDSIDPGRTCECRSRRRGMCSAGEHRARPNRAWFIINLTAAGEKFKQTDPQS